MFLDMPTQTNLSMSIIEPSLALPTRIIPRAETLPQNNTLINSTKRLTISR